MLSGTFLRKQIRADYFPKSWILVRQLQNRCILWKLNKSTTNQTKDSTALRQCQLRYVGGGASFSNSLGIHPKLYAKLGPIGFLKRECSRTVVFCCRIDVKAVSTAKGPKPKRPHREAGSFQSVNNCAFQMETKKLSQICHSTHPPWRNAFKNQS